MSSSANQYRRNKALLLGSVVLGTTLVTGGYYLYRHYNTSTSAPVEKAESEEASTAQLSVEEQAMALKQKGNGAYKAKDYDTAIDFYKQAIALKENAVFYSNLSACYLSQEKYEDALAIANKALELDADYSTAFLRKIVSLEGLERYEDALYDLTVWSLDHTADSSRVERTLERILSKKAKNSLEAMKKKNEGKPRPLPSITFMCSFFSAFNLDTKLEHFDENNKADVMFQEALDALNLYSEKGFSTAEEKFTTSLKLYKEQLTSSDDEILKEKASMNYLYCAIFKYLRDELKVSAEYSNKSLELHPNPNAHVFLALNYADNGDSTKAFEAFEKAIELDPSYPPSYYHRGQMYFVMQQYDQAKKDFIKAKELAPENIFPMIQLSCLEYRQGDFDKCKAGFDKVREKFPTAPEVPTYFGEILTDRENYDEAIQQYKIARKLEDVQSRMHVGVAPLLGQATILVRRSNGTDIDEPLKLFEAAEAMDPRSEQAKAGLAQLMLQTGTVDKAISLFEETAVLVRGADEQLQSMTFAEAARVQKRLRQDPALAKKITEKLASYQQQ